MIKIYAFILLAVFLFTGCHTGHTSHSEQKDLPYEHSRAEKFHNLATNYLKKNVPDSAFYYYNASKEALLKSHDSIAISNRLLDMAEVQLQCGDYFGCQHNLCEAMSYNTKHDKTIQTRLYYILGASYKNLFNYKKAIYYFKEACKEAKDPVCNLRLKCDIANMHIEMGHYDTAISTLTKIKSARCLAKAPQVKASILDALGYASFKKDGKGVDDLKKALYIRQTIKDTAAIAVSCQHLSRYYSANNPNSAKQYALLAYNYSKRTNNPDYLVEALSLLVANSSGTDLKKYSSEYIAFENSIEKNRLALKNKFAVISSDEILPPVQNLPLPAASNKILVYALICLSLISLFAFMQLRQRYKKEKLLEAYTAETRISKKVHDEIANEIYGTMHYVANEDVVSGEKKDILMAHLDSIYSRTRNISRENNDIDTSANYAGHLKLMLTAYSCNKVNVITKGITAIDWEKIDTTKKITTYRVLQELMVNMKKHSAATVVVVDFTIEKKKIKITYCDNGVGIITKEIILKNGLQNVENRIDSIGGNINFGKQQINGFNLSIVYPVNTPYV
jgi:signal transduction histidine kinase